MCDLKESASSAVSWRTKLGNKTRGQTERFPVFFWKCYRASNRTDRTSGRKKPGGGGHPGTGKPGGKPGDRRNVFRFLKCWHPGKRSGAELRHFSPSCQGASAKPGNVPSVTRFTRFTVTRFTVTRFTPPRLHAARYLSRHSFEQKYNTCPSTVRVTLAPVET